MDISHSHHRLVDIDKNCHGTDLSHCPLSTKWQCIIHVHEMAWIKRVCLWNGVLKCGSELSAGRVDPWVGPGSGRVGSRFLYGKFPRVRSQVQIQIQIRISTAPLTPKVTSGALQTGVRRGEQKCFQLLFKCFGTCLFLDISRKRVPRRGSGIRKGSFAEPKFRSRNLVTLTACWSQGLSRRQVRCCSYQVGQVGWAVPGVNKMHENT